MMTFAENELNLILSTSFRKDNPFKELKQSGIILYGAGSLGKMAVNLLKTVDIKPQYIIDKSFEGNIDGINVISLNNVPLEDKSKYSLIISISSLPYEPIFNDLKENGFKDIRQFYDLSEMLFPNKLNNGWYKDRITKYEKEKILALCESLSHDEYSLSHYLQFLWWRIKRVEKTYKSFPVLSNKNFFNAPIKTKLDDNEIFLDAGAHNGGSTLAFMKAINNKFHKIIAIEPDEKNLNDFKQNTSHIDQTKLQILQVALSSKSGKFTFEDNLGFASKLSIKGNKKIDVYTIDELIDEKITIMKLHLEGNELDALYGAGNTIKKYRPIIMVLADHNEDGLYKIGNYLSSLEDYRLNFYLHDYCGNSAVFYAIPREKFIN